MKLNWTSPLNNPKSEREKLTNNLKSPTVCVENLVATLDTFRGFQCDRIASKISSDLHVVSFTSLSLFISPTTSICISPHTVLARTGIYNLPPFPSNRVLTISCSSRTHYLSGVTSNFVAFSKCFEGYKAQAGSWQSTRTHIDPFL
jgi:hypothetical protein